MHFQLLYVIVSSAWRDDQCALTMAKNSTSAGHGLETRALFLIHNLSMTSPSTTSFLQRDVIITWSASSMEWYRLRVIYLSGEPASSDLGMPITRTSADLGIWAEHELTPTYYIRLWTIYHAIVVIVLYSSASSCNWPDQHVAP